PSDLKAVTEQHPAIVTSAMRFRKVLIILTLRIWFILSSNIKELVLTIIKIGFKPLTHKLGLGRIHQNGFVGFNFTCFRKTCQLIDRKADSSSVQDFGRDHAI